MPLPSPVRPMPSVVVADSETSAPPSANEITEIASARRVPILGRLPIICTVIFEIEYPAAVMITNVSWSNCTPLAPAYCGRSIPKLLPKSPRAVAANRASQIAWAATSPSEWPSTPSWSGQNKPASHNWRPTPKAWASLPIPLRYVESKPRKPRAVCRSAAVVIFNARSSPAIIFTFPPLASMSAPSSVASPPA